MTRVPIMFPVTPVPKRTRFTMSVKTAAATIDLRAWVAVYVREVVRLEGYSLAAKRPSSNLPLEEVG